jgi:hypothetical protein
MRPRRQEKFADFCEVCGRLLISRPVRRMGRCGAHPRQPTLPPTVEPSPTPGRKEGP